MIDVNTSETYPTRQQVIRMRFLKEYIGIGGSKCLFHLWWMDQVGYLDLIEWDLLLKILNYSQYLTFYWFLFSCIMSDFNVQCNMYVAAFNLILSYGYLNKEYLPMMFCLLE